MRAFVIVVLLVLGFSACLQAQTAMPQIKSVEPDAGKSGDVITVTGENLDKANVVELYLTDGKNDTKVVMNEQTATTIKFEIPAAVKPGRLALMFLTGGKTPKLIEEPVKLTIE